MKAGKVGWMTVLMLGLAGSGAAAAEAVLFEEASNGILELSGHSRLHVEGVKGTVFVRAGKAGELRYSVASRDSRRDPHPVGLWLRGGTIIFRPVAGQEADEIILEVALSEGIRLSVEKSGGKVQVASVLGEVEVQAVDSQVDIRGAGESVSVELEGGTLRLENLSGAVEVDGTKVSEVLLNRLSGNARVSLTESAVRAEGLRSLELDLSATTLELSGAAGQVRGSVIDGNLSLTNARGGADLQLENTPLSLDRSRGAFAIETDAGVAFQAIEGSLNVRGFGGSVIGTGAGEISVQTQDATVSLTNVAGPVVVNGDALNVELKEVRNTIKAELVGSELNIAGAKAGFDVKNEFGNVVAKGVEGPTKIVSRQGDVHVQDLSGSIEIDAEGPVVRVGWRSIARDRDSRIENTAGDVHVALPSGGAARVEAVGSSIDTNIEGLEIGDGGRFANGLVGGAERPTISLKASGTVSVSQGP